MIATICSSVKRTLRIAPSEAGASLLRNQWSEIPEAGPLVPRPSNFRGDIVRVGLNYKCGYAAAALAVQRTKKSPGVRPGLSTNPIADERLMGSFVTISPMDG